LAALNSDALAGFKFVFAMDRPSFVDQTLDLLGVPAERRVYYDPNRLALFESLALIPVPVFERHFLCTSALHDLRRELLKHVDVNDKERPRKIFFTRRDALTSERILINEAEVVAKLEAIGFKAFELGDVSVVEQIRLTHAADTVVYIHGSAGANLIFVKPGANVLHVFPDCVSFFVSHGIGTAAVGAKYGYLFGPSFQRSIRYHNNPWLVSPERTANAIKRLETQ
jgi:capsular polysaccharide biosynthesis protein